jgi:hypothetical protein
VTDELAERELAERVERGAALLDERRPGWWNEVVGGALDLSDECNCTLGQLWGTYTHGTLELFSGELWEASIAAGRHGFDAESNEHFSPLTDLWRAAIERRRAADRTTT